MQYVFYGVQNEHGLIETKARLNCPVKICEKKFKLIKNNVIKLKANKRRKIQSMHPTFKGNQIVRGRKNWRWYRVPQIAYARKEARTKSIDARVAKFYTNFRWERGEPSIPLETCTQ